MSSAKDVITNAAKGATYQGDKSIKMPEIGAELTSLPLGAMISGPLNAAIEAQALAARSTVEFIQQVGLDKDNKATTVEFKYQSGQGEKILNAPLLSIIPIPFIRVKDVSVDFLFKINTIASSKNEENQKIGGSADVKASVGYGPFSVSAAVNASYSNEKASESKSSVDKSAELKMHVNATQDEMPEGLKIVLTAITNSLAQSVESASEPKK